MATPTPTGLNVPIHDESYICTLDLSSSGTVNDPLIIMDDAANPGQVIVATADNGFGILVDSGKGAGTRVRVRELGIAPLKVNAQAVNIAAGDKIHSVGAGIGAKSTTNKDRVIAEALAPASADGVIIPVRLRCYVQNI